MSRNFGIPHDQEYQPPLRWVEDHWEVVELKPAISWWNAFAILLIAAAVVEIGVAAVRLIVQFY